MDTNFDLKDVNKSIYFFLVVSFTNIFSKKHCFILELLIYNNEIIISIYF